MYSAIQNDPFRLEGSAVDFEVESFDVPNYEGHNRLRSVCRVVHPAAPGEVLEFKGLGVVTNKHPVAGRPERHRPHVEFFKRTNNAIVKQFREFGMTNALDNVEVTYKTAHGGAFALQDVIYKNLTSPVESKMRNGSTFMTEMFLRSVTFRGLAGSHRMNTLFGPFDGYCLNGQIFGEGSWTKRKNTSGESVKDFVFSMSSTVPNFLEKVEYVRKLADIPITRFDAEDVITKLPISKALEKKLLEQYSDEARIRGSNLFALQSAFTNYSSHSDGAFNLNDTGSDHDAQTMLGRELEIVKWTETPAFLQLAA